MAEAPESRCSRVLSSGRDGLAGLGRVGAGAVAGGGRYARCPCTAFVRVPASPDEARLSYSWGEARPPSTGSWLEAAAVQALIADVTRGGEPLVVPHASDLEPDNAVVADARLPLRAAGITGVVIVPVGLRPSLLWTWVLGTVDAGPRWPRPVIDHLQLLGGVVAGLLERVARHVRTRRAECTSRATPHRAARDPVATTAPAESADSRNHRTESGAADGADDDGGSERHGLHGAAARRDGDREGTIRARAAPAREAACASPGERELWRAAAEPDRKRAVRTSTRRIHRGRGAAAGTLRAGSSRHALPGRDRRPGVGPAGQAAARAAGRRRSNASARPRPRPSMCASSRRPITTWSARWRRAGSGRISITG